MTATIAIAAPALAQSAPAGHAAVGTDVVHLKNGGLVRGTITELVPEHTVTIVTTAGKARDFSFEQVQYAGPADRDFTALNGEAKTSSATPSSGGHDPAGHVDEKSNLATVHFESEPPGITFHKPVSSSVAFGTHGAAVASSYQRLCTAPCVLTIPAGTETLAVSLPGSSLVREAVPITIPTGRSRVAGFFESRAGLRVAGWLIAAGSAVGLGVAMYASVGRKTECEPRTWSGGESCRKALDVNLPLFVGGVVGGSLGIGIGLGLAGHADEPTVQVRPASASLIKGRLPGLTVRGSF